MGGIDATEKIAIIQIFRVVRATALPLAAVPPLCLVTGITGRAFPLFARVDDKILVPVVGNATVGHFEIAGVEKTATGDSFLEGDVENPVDHSLVTAFSGKGADRIGALMGVMARMRGRLIGTRRPDRMGQDGSLGHNRLLSRNRRGRNKKGRCQE